MRLIDADELDFREINTPSPEMWDWINEHIGDWLDDQPTVDAVPVVRCGDCKYYVDEGMYCAFDIIVQFEHFYCYHGERKDDE